MFSGVKLWHLWSQNNGFRFIGSHFGSRFIMDYTAWVCVLQPRSLMNILARKILNIISTFLTNWWSLSRPFWLRKIRWPPNCKEFHANHTVYFIQLWNYQTWQDNKACCNNGIWTCPNSHICHVRTGQQTVLMSKKCSLTFKIKTWMNWFEWPIGKLTQ